MNNDTFERGVEEFARQVRALSATHIPALLAAARELSARVAGAHGNLTTAHQYVPMTLLWDGGSSHVMVRGVLLKFGPRGELEEFSFVIDEDGAEKLSSQPWERLQVETFVIKKPDPGFVSRDVRPVPKGADVDVFVRLNYF